MGPAAAALLGLCALALCGQPARSQTLVTNSPPEDLDGSGDDDDGFSGSGAGVLPERVLVPVVIQPRKIPVLTLTTPLTTAPTEPRFTGPTGPEASGEGSSVPPRRGPEVDPAPTQEPTGSSPAATLPSTTHPPSTEGASVAPDPTEAHPRVPAPEPPGPGDRDPSASEAPESDQPTRDSIQPLGEESSGNWSDDFTFAPPGDNSGSALERNINKKVEVTDPGATGASQNILDRKEVLGGVIAGGLVGLLFALFLVGFMLYRMKKKDEGSYSLEEPKQANGAYQKPQRQEEFYA
ncbi:syndecan-1 [Macrotis lagotis]|uniref:syndecan-1 n=1 Tax=Macrotis lagotis TaxID=92651 RepID=UPI003D692E34